ncbi:hypothetical protein [Microtetraspora glauca]|uniref:DUF222 domain-containing protein n=1 Tax=Microtetraspora glauca TaxID=1996 RepID=A0ABV3GSB4_MICGL
MTRGGAPAGSVWEDGSGYLDPETGEVLPTWDEALDELDQAPTRTWSKSLTKSIAGSLDPDDSAQREHAERLGNALRYELCSPTCPNWLR